MNGRTVSVPPSRVAGWLERFAARHGEPRRELVDGALRLSAPDGALAVADPPFGPLLDDDLVAHVTRPRRVGVLLVRKGGYAAGVFSGPELVSSKVGSRLVQGRTAAGGQSQQRFARRRANQAKAAYGDAADVAARILLPAGVAHLAAGGDRSGVEAVLADPRLAPLLPLRTSRLLDVPEPRLVVLRTAPELFGAVTVSLTDPD